MNWLSCGVFIASTVIVGNPVGNTSDAFSSRKLSQAKGIVSMISGVSSGVITDMMKNYGCYRKI